MVLDFCTSTHVCLIKTPEKNLAYLDCFFLHAIVSIRKLPSVYKYVLFSRSIESFW